MKRVTIIDYGAGNVASVKYALARMGVEAELTSDSDVILNAEKVIFPGVGHAAAAMQALQSKGLDLVIPRLKCPVLGICLGMQLMCNHTEEGEVDGLGIFSEKVLRFNKGIKVPHMGWNTIFKISAPLFDAVSEHSSVYFVHSYYVPLSENTVAASYYGSAFSAALQKDNFDAVQFHPEKSGAVGAQILQNFIDL
ncbi:MAG: imidazole glycerol phosphate synthase subunit HisH [Bacteroidota bacterium]|nr:imidazole glycerol phosphate synthase subunit HisH [Bacteroidota bacterium]